MMPKAQTSDDVEDRINLIVEIIKEDVCLLNFRVDQMQTELHLLRT